MTIEVTGIAAAQAALNDAIQDINIESELMVLAIIQGIRSNTIPYIPVATSFLINSEFQSTEVTPTGAKGEIGYGATYAVYVHEGPQKNWQKPGASNRFLEIGVRNFIADDLSGIIARFQP